MWGGWWQVSEDNRVQAFKTDKQKNLFSFSLKHTFVALNHTGGGGTHTPVSYAIGMPKYMYLFRHRDDTNLDIYVVIIV